MWRYSDQHSFCPQEVHILVENYFCHFLLGFVIISPLHVFPTPYPIFSYLLLNFFFLSCLTFSCFFLPCVLSCLLLNFFLILFFSSLLLRKFNVLFLPRKPSKPRNFNLYFESKINWYTYPAKLLQSCPTLCNPVDGSPPGFPIPGILQARTLEWVAIAFSSAWKWKVKVKSLSHVWLLATPWAAAYQAPPSMGFSRQEYWSGVPLPCTYPTSSQYRDLSEPNFDHCLLWLTCYGCHCYF